MPCYHPVTAYQFAEQNYGVTPEVSYPSGKPRLYFGLPGDNYLGSLFSKYGAYAVQMKVPCGKCEGCHMRRSGEWALRIVHESKYYHRTCFITLTYDHKHLPNNRTLIVKDFQDFMKRFRMRLYRGVLNERGVINAHLDRDSIGPRMASGAFTADPLDVETVTGIKYFACGEYGEAKGRPHYHAVILGWNFPDRFSVPNNPWAKDPLFSSPLLAETWGKGYVTLGDLSQNSAAYVAQYTMKKVYGPHADAEYKATGRTPPFNLMSKGIGTRFFNQYREDIFPCDSIQSENSNDRLQVPRFYDKLQKALEEAFIGPKLPGPTELEQIKQRRRERAEEPARAKDNTPERLAVREEILKLRIANLKKRRNMSQPEK